MACSRFEYVKHFERHESILPNCWFIVRIDGHGFHRFTKTHHFEKPNDSNGLQLANAAAQKVVEEFKDICAAYGQSDEYSFVFKRSCSLFERRQEKILSTVVSYFSSCYVHLWSQWMNRPLEYVPSFDGRIVVYPALDNVRDYLSWRQADCHINNLVFF
jgi:tRNA(His) guanylyltransferase